MALAFLYTAQGIPFGFATEYLPVVLREQGYSYAGIAALSWLQLPWQLKVSVGEGRGFPAYGRERAASILALQMALTACVAGFAIRPLAQAAARWFALTAIAAALAATQDVFVDAFAVRVLRPERARVRQHRAGRGLSARAC